MAKVIAIHGILNQFEGAESLKAEWLPRLRDGLTAAKRDPALLHPDDLAVVFYGGVFRPEGTKGSSEPPEQQEYDPAVIELLTGWCEAAADQDPSIARPSEEGPSKGFRTPRSVQWLLEQLSKSKAFSALGGVNFITRMIEQVWAYFTVPGIREYALDAVKHRVDGQTRVLIGHSLGSVIAYEALCDNPHWNIHTFVSCGSPLGIHNVVFERLKPGPVGGIGVWPNVRQWTNIADKGDIVALQKDLAKRFGERVRDVRVNNGWDPHSFVRYLNTREMGEAVAGGL